MKISFILKRSLSQNYRVIRYRAAHTRVFSPRNNRAVHSRVNPAKIPSNALYLKGVWKRSAYNWLFVSMEDGIVASLDL